MKCPICNSNSFFLRKINGFDIRKCGCCGLDFTYPMPSKKCIDEFYENYKDIRASIETVKRNAIRNISFLKSIYDINNKTSVLDFGCGHNLFIDVCRENGIEKSFGYDEYSETKKDRFISISEATQKKWDVITLWGVLEHLISPLDKMKQLRSILSKNGIIAFTTIYIEGKIPFQYKPPEHLFYFTKESILKLVEQCGMEIISFEEYRMEQLADIYLSILLRTAPPEYRDKIFHNLPEFIEVPTNEIRVVIKNE